MILLYLILINKTIKMNTIGSKVINAILENERINANVLAEKIGIPRTQTIYDLINSKIKKVSPNYADKILSAFPYYNYSWLLTGEGPMLKEEKPKYSEVSPVDSDDYMMVEYADLRASAGVLGMGDVTQLPDTHKRLVPKEYSNGKFMVVRVDGNSMYDGMAHSLGDGDEVLIFLNEEGINGDLPIKKTVFVITTRDGNVLKQISEINREQKYIVCHSWNKDFEDFKIKFEDIFQIFTVCKIVQKQISLV